MYCNRWFSTEPPLRGGWSNRVETAKRLESCRKMPSTLKLYSRTINENTFTLWMIPLQLCHPNLIMIWRSAYKMHSNSKRQIRLRKGRQQVGYLVWTMRRSGPANVDNPKSQSDDTWRLEQSPLRHTKWVNSTIYSKIIWGRIWGYKSNGLWGHSWA